MFFTGDHEPQHNIYEPEDPGYLEFERLIAEKEARIAAFIKDVDVLIVDAMYTDEEIGARRGWGHGTFDSGLRVAKLANAKNVYFTHHDPMRTDAQLDEILKTWVEPMGREIGGNGPQLHLARDGFTIEL